MTSSNHSQKPIPLGVPGAPWPTMIRHEEKVGGNVVTTFEMGVMEDPDNPLILHSNRPYAEVAGEFYRDMPVPSMLPALEFVISRSDPAQINRVANLVSDPGTGKSFLAIMVGNARDSRRPIVTDAGGKNLEYLLFETVFDVEASKTLTRSIDEALSKNSLDGVSINALRKFGKHFSEQGGRMSVDWNGLVNDQSIGTDEIRSTLELIRSVERWDANQMGIGFRTKEGPLVQAHREGRDLIIDEINKGKPGTETPLQIVWQVLNGEIAEHTVKLGSNGDFKFERGKSGTVICTGNLPKDGVGTHLISESFDRRVPGFRIANFDQVDWQHRICQKLTGLPVSTLHRMQKGQWKKDGSGKDVWVIDDPDGFTKLLTQLRNLGLSDEERQKIPDWQMSMIANWKGVLNASERLAHFYYNWSQLVNPDSPVFKSSMPEVLSEIENPDDPTSKVTPSTMIRQIQDAIQIRPPAKPVKDSGGFSTSHDWSAPPPVGGFDKESPESKLGSRLAQIIMDEVQRTSQQVGKEHLYAHLRAHAENAGLVGTNAAIPKLLNVDVSKLPSAPTDAKSMQKTLAALLRAQFPDMNLSPNDDHVVPLRQVEAAMAQLSGLVPKGGEPEALSAFSNVMHVVNVDVNTITQKPTKPVVTDGLAQGEEMSHIRSRLPADKLLGRVELLASLVLPATGSLNLKALWNKTFSNGADPGNAVTAVAQNQHDSGLAITSLVCKDTANGKVSYAKMHVVQNNKANKTLIIGTGDIPAELKNQMKKKGITYIDQSAPSAENLANAAIRSMMDQAQESLVRSAFMMRNWRPKQDEEQPLPSLAVLLTKPCTTLMVPHFITSLRPDRGTHADRTKGGNGGGVAL
jgi:hypothetical protein